MHLVQSRMDYVIEKTMKFLFLNSLEMTQDNLVTSRERKHDEEYCCCGVDG